MKCSIITVTYNALRTLPATVESFQGQSYRDKEHIIIDGGSEDGTSTFLRQLNLNNLSWTSESDRGIYDAMNKGILGSTGSVIGILNADDVFYDSDVLQNVMTCFHGRPNLDAVYCDVVFTKKGRVWRHYSAKQWKPHRLAWGFMPPHPGVFLRREIFDRFGYYKTDYQIAADYELLIRLFWKHNIQSTYLPFVSTNMSLGGVSTRSVKSNLILNQEIKRACLENGLSTNYFKIYSKYLFKWKELV